MYNVNKLSIGFPLFAVFLSHTMLFKSTFARETPQRSILTVMIKY